MLTVGLTGGLGSGKTTVLAFFKKCGASVLGADDIVHRQLKTNKVLRKKIRRLFGAEVFGKGEIQRELLAKKVFGRPKELRKLTALVHPLVKTHLFALIRQRRRLSSQAVVVAEMPLLFEAGFDKFFDVTVGVSVEPRIQRGRLLKISRFSRKDMALRMRGQLPAHQKIMRCDFVIDNNAGKMKTFQQVKKLMSSLKEGKKWKSSK